MKQPRLHPVHIRLNDLPPEGKTFEYSRESGELNSTLAEFIGQNPYTIRFEIHPIGNAFELRGTASTKMDLACSLCGIDFKQDIQEKLHEVIVIQEELPRVGHEARVNHTTELEATGPSYLEIPSPDLNVAEYIHEIIGLAVPLKPLGKKDCETSCENADELVRQGLLIREQDAEKTKNSPFGVLKDLKLNS